MTTSTSSIPQVPIDQIADEHRALTDTVGRLGKTTDPHQLLPRLEKLRDQLEHHFASEEGNDGLRSDVRKLAPFLLTSLEKIFEEHRRFLADIEALEAKTRACIDGPLAEILDDTTALVRRLHNHEQRESELLSDVYYTDYGQGD